MAKNKQTSTSTGQKTRIETLVTQAEFFMATANQDLENTDPRTRPGKEAAKRDAEEVLEGILAEYEHELRKGLVGLFVNGESASVDRFASIASEEGPAVVVDASDMYYLIAADVEPTMRGDRMFEPTQFSAMLRSMTKVTDLLGIRFVPTPDYTGDVYLPTFEDIVNHVRNLIRAKVGDTLNELLLVRQVTEQALRMGYSREILPVVVKNATPDEINGFNALFMGRTVSTTAEGEVTQKQVFDKFTELKKLIQSN